MSSQLFQPSRFSICRGFTLLFLTKICLSRKLYTRRELWTQQNADVLKKDLHLQPTSRTQRCQEKGGKKGERKKDEALALVRMLNEANRSARKTDFDSRATGRHQG